MSLPQNTVIRGLASGDRTYNWRDDASCRDGDPERFFQMADSEQGRKPYAWERAAKRVCLDECPVLEQCRAWALAVGQECGVAGGMTAQERRAARRNAPVGREVRAS